MKTLTQVLTQWQLDIHTATDAMLLDTGQEFADKVKAAGSDWKIKPDASVEISYPGANITEVLVKPSGSRAKIWKYIDLGTGLYGARGRSYVITPKTPGGYLKFRTGYSARTAPIAQYGVGTGTANGPWVQKRMVIHPGIKSRKFFQTWLEELSPDLSERELQYLSNAL